MNNISEYDLRQLKLMYETLTAFENGQMMLNSLVSNLEFLLTALETVNPDWEERFLNQITTLESINALEIIRNANETSLGIEKNEKKIKINMAISSLKKLIEGKLGLP